MGTVSPGSEAAQAPIRPLPQMTAVRGGALLFAAMVVGNAFNYGFAIVAGRVLGPSDYGVLTALLALVMILLLPLGSVQMALAREIAHSTARGDDLYAAALVKRAMRMTAVATAVMAIVFTAAIAPLSYLLQIDGLGPVAVTGLSLLPAIATLVLMGDLQGLQRYGPLSMSIALPPVLRLILFGALVALGASLYGALIATAVAAVFGLAATGWWARDTLRARVADIDVDVLGFLRYLAPVAIGVLAVTALTNIDVLVVKGRLSSEDAGIYGAASNLAKLAVFLPSAIIGVLFPRVAARVARGIASDDILGRALVVTLGFCMLLFGAYAVAGDAIVNISFGSAYDEVTPLLPLFGVGMTCFSLANVLVSYELSLGNHGYAVALAVAAGVQALLLCLVPAGLTNLLWVNAVVGIGVLATYQLQRGGAIAAMWLGLTHMHQQAAPARRAASGIRAIVAHRAIVAEAAGVLAGAALAAVVLTWPLAADLGGGVLGRGDPLGGVAWLWRTTQEGGFGLVGQTHVYLTGAPFGWDQGNGVNIQWLLPYLPAHLTTGLIGEVASYNLVVLSGLALSGGAMYWLVRRLGAGPLAAAWGGLVYMSFPWLLARAESHASLTHIWGFPLLLIAVIAWRERPDAQRVLMVAAALAALWMTSGYFGLMGLVVVGVAIPLGALLGRPAIPARRRLRTLATAWAACAAGVLVIFGISRLGTGRGAFGLDGSATELATYGARVHEYLMPPATNPYIGDRTEQYLQAHQHGSNPGETVLYVGLLTLGLAAAWLVAGLARWRSRGSGTRFLLALLPVVVLAGLVFSLPSPLNVGGLELTGPSRIVNALAPEFRVPSRFVVVVMAALVPMAALGLAGIAGRVAGMASGPTSQRQRLGRLAGAGVVVVAAIVSHAELSTARAPVVRLDSAPPEYALLQAAPPGILAEYPLLAARDPASSDTLVWQREHNRPLLNGAPAGTPGDGARTNLLDPAAAGTASALAALGVTAVIDRRDPTRALELGPGYALIGRASDGVAVWRVTSRPGVAIAFEGFGQPEAVGPGVWQQWSLAARGTIGFYAGTAGLYQARFRMGSYGPGRQVVFSGGARAESLRVGAIQPQTLLIRLPRGRSTITWSTDPGPQPIPDGRHVGITMSNWTISSSEPPSGAGRAVTATPVEAG